jgi:uncharacterized membrane protein
MVENVFSHPRAWAQRAIGTPTRYRLFQLQFFTTALAILSIFFAASRDVPKTLGWWILFSAGCVFVVTGVVWTPLMLLHALRAHVSDVATGRGFDVIDTRRGDPAAH